MAEICPLLNQAGNERMAEAVRGNADVEPSEFTIVLDASLVM